MSLPAARPRIIGAKLPLRPMHVWAIRVRLQIAHCVRDLALFDIALDSKLRGCDVVALLLADIMAAGGLRRRATVIQQKTGRPVQFEITEQARRSLSDWLNRRRGDPDGWLFPSRIYPGARLSTRQYIRLLNEWVTLIGLEPAAFGTHSLRRTKVSILYRKTGNVRACQLLLVTPSWKARFVISEWSWIMRWNCPRGWISSQPLMAGMGGKRTLA